MRFSPRDDDVDMQAVWQAGESQAVERLNDVGLVVLDEVHYLGDPSRGSVWEEVIINCPAHIQLCAMSATVANADDLGAWIDEVISPSLVDCLFSLGQMCFCEHVVSEVASETAC